MPRIPTRPVQPFVYLITTVALALIFTSCDQAGLAPSPEAPAGAAPETLTSTPIPNGASLLEPGASPAAKQSGASPYGCYLASRPYTDEVRFRSVYLHFPEDVVEAADGETEPLIRRVSASPDGSVPGEKDIRYMNCVIPKTPDAKELVTEQLLRAGMYDAAEAALQEADPQSSAKDDAPCHVIVTVHVTCVGSVDNPHQYCTVDRVEEQQMCGGSTGGDPNEVNIEWPDGYGGGDSSGGGSGNGSCTEFNPPPGSDCEPIEAPADPPASKSEVASKIREECSDVPGVTLPGNDDALSGYFQASARKSLNALLPEMRRYQWDGVAQNHPQLTNPVDGYAEAVTFDGLHLPGVVSSILEVKFTETPSNLLTTSQWQTHIEDLERYYDRLPDNDYNIGSPLYLLVTNSTYSSIENLGGDESVNIPAHASDRGVNVMHLQVTKDFNGRYHLEGDLIGTADALNWIADIFEDVKLPLQVACQSED